MKHEARLRKVGGSVMLAIPPAVLEVLEIGADSAVDLAVRNGKLVVEPQAKPRYTLDQLLAETAKPRRKDRAWVAGKANGRELI